MNISLVLQNPSPHQVALLNALAKENTHQFRVSYLKGESVGREWGTPKPDIPELKLPVTANRLFGSELSAWIDAHPADFWVISTVYTALTTHKLSRLLARKGIPFLYMAEPPRPHGGPHGFAQRVLARNLLSKAAGLVTMGQESIRRYHDFTHGELPAVSVPYYPDSALPRTPKSPRPDQTVRFLCSAQLIQRKGIDILIKACESLPAAGWSLDLYGAGPDELTLKASLKKHSSLVTFRGTLPYESRCAMFNDADVLILPTRWDGWGMVIPEAMGHGLPVIATDQAMSAHEFVNDNVNGFIGPADRVSFLVDSMLRFINGTVNYGAFSQAAIDALRNYDPETGAANLVKFIEQLSHDKEAR